MRNFIFLLTFLNITYSAQSQNLDVRIFRALNDHHSKASDRFWEFQSNTVKPAFIATPILFFGLGLLKKDAALKNNSIQFLAADVINLGLTAGLKYSIDRTRPYKKLKDVHTVGSVDRTPSFPSGHTSSAFTVATSLSLAYPKWYVIVPSYMWAGCAGYSRIKLGMHYPTDVLAGALTGVGSAWISYKLQKFLHRF